ncbi:hypothetical protein [Sporosarcina sp. G11-34]|uniref:hypothetical protein n=1 Tax=Sporosarcina sp. G11-34 TaxID=2849605 RepID=UPI0022A93168|nr:hypothetical protein [Sporosarcina sp. G11-34]MCZ2258289.1 hypothetical protein [Sporosarcina sp. G11-34]
MEIYDVALIPLIIGIVELLKFTGLRKKLLPVVSLLFGVLAGVFYVYPGDLKGGILVGVMMGLSASGMYSGGKALIEQPESDK